MNSAPGEKEPGQPTANIVPLRRFVHRMSSAVSPRMRSWEGPQVERVAWNKPPRRARSQPPAGRIHKRGQGGTEVNEWTVDDLRHAVRTGSGVGDYTLLFLWIKFWSNGGGACIAELGAFIQGLQALSDNDSVVLGIVVDELRSPDSIATAGAQNVKSNSQILGLSKRTQYHRSEHRQ